MKNLKDVLEKLKVDDITFDVFPIDGKIKDIVKFLEEEGFKEIFCKDDVVDEFNKCKCKCFYRTLNIIRFADTSKEETSAKNPIFYIFFLSTPIYSVFYRGSNYKIIDMVESDKKEFLEKLNKRFGWK